MTDTTARLSLPLLAPGQAQKELFHNEALALLDVAVQPSVAAAGADDPPAAPVPGDTWIVGTAPTGAWAGSAAALAGWTAGGWRFVAPVEGMTAWSRADAMPWRYQGGKWRRGIVAADRVLIDGTPVVGAQQPAIAAPTGGATVDVEARTALAAILAALGGHGLIAA